MANIRTLNVTAVVDLTRLRSGLMAADSLTNQFGAKIAGHLKGMTAPSIDFGKLALGVGAFAVAYKAFDGLKSGINNAAHLNEAIAQTKALFGSTAGVVTSFGQNYAKQFGFAATEVTDIQNRLGGMAKGMGGMGDAEAAEFANVWMSKIADISAFKDISFKEAADAVAIGLRGEQSDVLATMGIDTRVSNLDTIAAQKGMKKPGATWGAANTLSLATQAIDAKLGTGGVNALGAVQRELTGTTSQMRILEASTTNFGIKVGNALMPAFDSALGVLNKFGAGITNSFDANQGRISAFASNLSMGFAQVGALVNYLLPSFQAIGATLSGAFSGGGEALSGMIPSFATIGTVAQSAFDGINAGLQGFIGFVRDIPGMLDASFGPGTAAMFGEIAGGIAAAAAAMTVLSATFSAAAGILAVVTAPLISIPVIAAAAGVGVAYLTGNFKSLGESISDANFALENAGGIWDWLSSTEGITDWGHRLFGGNPDEGKFDKNGVLIESDDAVRARERLAGPQIARAKAQDIAGGLTPAQEALKRVKDAEDQAAKLRTSLNQDLNPLKKASEASDPHATAEKAKEAKETEATLKKFTEAIKTPFEQYKETMDRLASEYAKGSITAAQFQKANAFAAKEAGISTAPKLGAAIEASSKEGYSLMAQAMGAKSSLSGEQTLEKAANTTADYTKKIWALQSEQLKRESAKPVILAIA